MLRHCFIASFTTNL